MKSRAASVRGTLIVAAVLVGTSGPRLVAATPFVNETIDATGNVGFSTSIALDGSGNPRISYRDSFNSVLKYASRSTSTWTVETVDARGSTGTHTSLEIDAQGNPVISYYDASNSDARLADSRVRVFSPNGGETWPVGATRDITWSGNGIVDVYISTTAGSLDQLVLEDVTWSPITLRVPHVPTRFARVVLRRASFFSVDASDSSFTIETSIALLSFAAAPPSATERGVRLTWATSPGPEDLAGYRLERGGGEAMADSWRTLVDATRETSFVDDDGGPGTRYRLTAINGLGEEYVVGETSAPAASALAAWPTPYRGGSLTISYATLGGFGDGAAQVTLALYDAAGRRRATLVDNARSRGQWTATWDGTDASRRPVAPGVYFLKLEALGVRETARVAVVR